VLGLSGNGGAARRGRAARRLGTKPRGIRENHLEDDRAAGIWLAIYLAPVPAGLNANQWHYFALFAAVIAGLILESMPVGAVGLIGLTVAGVLGYVEPIPTNRCAGCWAGFPKARCG
jgi:hypothetical protein